MKNYVKNNFLRPPLPSGERNEAREEPDGPPSPPFSRQRERGKRLFSWFAGAPRVMKIS